MTLTEFVYARLDECERPGWRRQRVTPTAARALREIVAEVAWVETHPHMADDADMTLEWQSGDTVLRHLGSIWSDRADYDEVWRPHDAAR